MKSLDYFFLCLWKISHFDFFNQEKNFFSEQKNAPGRIQDIVLAWIKLGFKCCLQKYLRCDLPRSVNMA